MAPNGEYDGSICVTAAMRAVATITVATCSNTTSTEIRSLMF